MQVNRRLERLELSYSCVYIIWIRVIARFDLKANGIVSALVLLLVSTLVLKVPRFRRSYQTYSSLHKFPKLSREIYLC